MQEYILYLFYLAILLLLGILVTAITNRLKLSNILFLVIIGFFLKEFDLNFFNNEIILVLSSLALIIIVLETSTKLDLFHIKTKFLNVLRFSICFFLICTYTLTLLVFQFFDIPGDGFEVLVLCLLLSIIIYGADPAIVTEFFRNKRYRAMEMLKIEGIISGPLVVVFSFFIIDYLNSDNVLFTLKALGQLLVIIKQFGIAIVIGGILAYIFYKVIKTFNLTEELYGLSLISLGIIIFAFSESLNINGTLSVAFFGIFLSSFIKKDIFKRYSSMLAHILYLIVFILLGLSFEMPPWILWIKGIGLFFFYIGLRFFCILIFFKNMKFGEKLFMTLNIAKGIEVAFVLLIISLNFSHLEGINIIVSL